MRRILFLLTAVIMVVGLSAQTSQITTSQIRDTAATRQKIKTDAIDSTRIQNGTVSLRDLHSGGASTNQFLKWNGSRWVPAAAITSLGGLTGATQTFATGTSGSGFNISSIGTTHTFNIADATASTRGFIGIGSQTFGGDKEFNGHVTAFSNLSVGRPSLTNGELEFYSQSGESIFIIAPDGLSNTYPIILPADPAPGAGYYLRTSGIGEETVWASDIVGNLQAVTDVGNVTTRSIRSDSLFWVRGTEASLTGVRLTNTTASTGQGWTFQSMNLGSLQLKRSGSGNVMTRWSGNDLFQYRNGNFGPVLTTIDAARVVGIDSVSFDISSAIENKSANPAAGAIFVAKTVSGGGNPLLLLQSGSQSYHVGVLNSAADTLYVGPGSTPGSTPSYSIDPSGMLRFKGTGGVVIPSGTTGQRAAVYGALRWNTSTPGLERYNGSTWDAIGGGSGSSSVSGLTAATASNTIDNLNYGQTWAWSTLSSGTSFLSTANALTTGTILQLSTSNNSVNSTNGLLYVANNGSSPNGRLAAFANTNSSEGGLFIQTNDRIGINETAPSESLEVTGNVKVNGQITSVIYTLTDGATIAIDWNNGNSQRVVLGGNRTITFSNPKPGTHYTLEIIQDATGSRTVTWPTIKWPSGITPVLTVAANKEDVISLYYNGSSYLAVPTLNF